MPWSPAQYHQFQKDRFAPFEDLCARIKARARMSVVDLGCGTGELTRRLADRLPESDVLGIDSSEEMLNGAREREREGLRFERAAIEEIKGARD